MAEAEAAAAPPFGTVAALAAAGGAAAGGGGGATGVADSGPCLVSKPTKQCKRGRGGEGSGGEGGVEVGKERVRQDTDIRPAALFNPSTFTHRLGVSIP